MDRAVLAAFLGVVVLGGVNGVGIAILNREIDPLWGATLRFALASLLLFALVAVRRIPLPRDAALAGTVAYGLLYFALGFGLIHWALVWAPPGMTQVVLAVVPLLAFLLAAAHGVERFRWRGLFGALLALSGVVVVFGDRLGGSLSSVVLLAIGGGALAIAEGTVVVKRFPGGHPVSANAVAMGVGAVLLLAASILAGEAWTLPQRAEIWGALAYLASIGSVVVFVLFLFLVSRWTASATSYVWPLLPLVAVPVSALVLRERVTPLLLLGGALVVLGVYVGAFAGFYRSVAR